MNKAINQQLIDNISQLLKRALVADEILEQLRTQNKASFSAIFTKDSGFASSANTFSPYIEEISNELLLWQSSQDKILLVTLVKKIEALFKVLGQFEHNIETDTPVLNSNTSTKH